MAHELGWTAVIASAEERLNPIEVDPATNDKTVRRKVHRAEREGVKVVEVDGKMDEDVKRRIEERCKDWTQARKGTQIHLTGVRPFDDMIHRKYFYATDKEGKVCFLQCIFSDGNTDVTFSDVRSSRSCTVIPETRFPNQMGFGVPRCTIRSD